MKRILWAALGLASCAGGALALREKESRIVSQLSFSQEALTVGMDRAREPAAAAGVPHVGGNDLPYGTWLEDFDGDQRPDVYVANHGQAPHLSGLWANLGDRFAANIYTTNFSGGNPSATGWVNAIADFTGDGLPDILTGGWNGYGELCTNSRTATFVCHAARSGSHVADVNGDGRPDVWVLNPSTTYDAYSDVIGALPHAWALNNGSPDMTTWTLAPALGYWDFDGDGYADRLEGIPTADRGTYGLATSGQIFFRGGPGGSWTETTSGLEAVTDPAAQVVDINEDGCLDVGFDPTGYRDNPYWYVQGKNTGGCLGTFSLIARTALPYYPGFARYAADLDNDGVTERVVLVHSAYGNNDGVSGGAHIYARSGSTWAEVTGTGLAHQETYYDALTFGDWNGDGLLDIGDAEAPTAGTDHGIALWTNHTSTTNRWVDVVLPELSGPFVGHARIAVAGQTQDILPGAWGSQRHHFGVGAADVVSVSVSFPDAVVVTLQSATNKVVPVTEAMLAPAGDAGAPEPGPEPHPEPAVEPRPEPRPEPVVEPPPVDAPVGGATGTQLLQDPGFETSVSSFFASWSGDTLERVTANTLAGAGSLHVVIGSYNSAWWSGYVQYDNAVNHGSSLAFSADVRRESASTGHVQLCAVAYTVSGQYLEQCSAGATGAAGAVQHMSVALALPSGTMQYLKARIKPVDGATCDYTVDAAALVLVP